jgi:ABC-type bacteriocin/lantibiotic exporter with double-glycine peptidase domain
MISPQIRTFFLPIFHRHKSIFLLLLLDGFIAGISSVITPILLKLETDQLVWQKWGIFFFWELSGFQVFIAILLLILLTDIITRLIQRVSWVFLDAQKEYLTNHIQLELFQKMNMMEVWRSLSNRFRHIARVLDSEFGSFSDTLVRLPGGILQKIIQITGITAIFAYFDIRFLFIVIASAICSYLIDRYAEILRQKYEVHWKFSLGQKVYFYNDLFLRSFGQLATNGAVKTTLENYRNLLDEQIRQGLKKNWAELTWTFSGLLTGSLSSMLIKIIVWYSVFQWTQSIGIVALVVSSMGTVEEIINSIIKIRKGYLRFRFQESSILLFLEMCEPIGDIDEFNQDIQQIQGRNIGFAYPNLSIYEQKYMDIVGAFMKRWKTGSKWIDEAFEDLVKWIEADMKHTNPIILRETSFLFERGMIYWIVGKNGAGKTTIMQLLAWFYRSYSGEILYNDTSIKNWTPELLARQISFLTQEPFFMTWGSTIRDNLILWVANPSEPLIWEYLERFWLADKIRKSPDGLESESGEKIDFSGWEKQILTFIRLLLQDRPIIIMDEGTNQLDAENEIIVMNELLKQKKDKIIIFITHRMSTISKVDWIYCLEGATISVSWKHRDLMATGDNPYARFYQAQVMHENVV